MKPMTQPARKSVKDEIDEIRRNGDPRFSAKARQLAKTMFTTSEYGEAVDQLIAGDFDELDNDE